ncbi:glycoside hydrolase family 6 protein [Streptomyces sp. NEAU-Y11]|uniref:glycoside hydrolase family 6 protein n=1 Tax=Streptomyces cucumeris TaxID=2962890 RepID=UPI0027E501C9|nr:glycoside hydrolase family 6 protein [Streptomyces sp. NEAU-Y11]
MRSKRKALTAPMAVLAATALPLLSSSAVQAAAPQGVGEALRGNRLYTPPPERDPYRQVSQLAWRGESREARGILSMVRTPQAVWYGDESPEEVERTVRTTTRRAEQRGTLPVLTLYDVPGRDCGSYSSGGAGSTAEYQAWIDAVARGIGQRPALVVLEPDSLALLPSDCAKNAVGGGDGAGAADGDGGEPEAQASTLPAEADPATPADGQTADGQSEDTGAGAAATGEGELPPLPDPGIQSAPATGAPSDAPSAAGQPAAEKPAAGQSPAQSPAAQTPAAQSPAAGQTAAQTPASPKPAGTQAPAAQSPAAQTPAARAPGARTPAPSAPAAETPGILPSPEPSASATAAPEPALPDPDTDTGNPEVVGDPADLTDPEGLDQLIDGEDPKTAARYSEINYAVDVLTALDETSVYLDAGHPGWHSVSSIVPRLLKAGVDRAAGFALNVSHYQTDAANTWYGRLISSCLAYADEGGDPADCADRDWSQRRARAWVKEHTPADASGLKHFVTDTSRNGQGPWTPTGSDHSDPQPWCNPPDRGLGVRPTTRTDDPLQDAALWVKTPGESDGRCLRGTAGPEDPERGTVDPEAGEWFPDQALELVRFARPAVD